MARPTRNRHSDPRYVFEEEEEDVHMSHSDSDNVSDSEPGPSRASIRRKRQSQNRAASGDWTRPEIEAPPPRPVEEIIKEVLGVPAFLHAFCEQDKIRTAPLVASDAASLAIAFNLSKDDMASLWRETTITYFGPVVAENLPAQKYIDAVKKASANDKDRCVKVSTAVAMSDYHLNKADLKKLKVEFVARQGPHPRYILMKLVLLDVLRASHRKHGSESNLHTALKRKGDLKVKREAARRLKQAARTERLRNRLNADTLPSVLLQKERCQKWIASGRESFKSLMTYVRWVAIVERLMDANVIPRNPNGYHRGCSGLPMGVPREPIHLYSDQGGNLEETFNAVIKIKKEREDSWAREHKLRSRLHAEGLSSSEPWRLENSPGWMYEKHGGNLELTLTKIRAQATSRTFQQQTNFEICQGSIKAVLRKLEIKLPPLDRDVWEAAIQKLEEESMEAAIEYITTQGNPHPGN